MFIHEVTDKILVIGTNTYSLIKQYGYDGADEDIDSIIPLIMDEPDYSGEQCYIVIPSNFVITEHYQKLLGSINSTELGELLKQVDLETQNNNITYEQMLYLKSLINDKIINNEILNTKKVTIRTEVWNNFHYQFFDENNNPVSRNHIEFVLSFLPISDGNDLTLEIDVETGQILNWKKPTAEDIKIY